MLPFVAEVERALDLHSLSSLKYIHVGHNLSRLWALVLLINRPEVLRSHQKDTYPQVMTTGVSGN